MWPAVIIVWEIWGIFLLADIFLGGKLFNQLLFIFVLFPEFIALFSSRIIADTCEVACFLQVISSGDGSVLLSTRRSVVNGAVLLRESEPKFPSERIIQHDCDMPRRQSSHCRLLSIKNMGNCSFNCYWRAAVWCFPAQNIFPFF